eukprot:TRINITY_DN8387_c0_g1_i2.p1 TRINITY_DN8387_c0_g1~~TRINITY_DN8387_c0_g1_i2.p1  ORF type:complete len:291 (+),score=42.85 TRINITY_DN8387_c0_g1_i2:94-873(+)
MINHPTARRARPNGWTVFTTEGVWRTLLMMAVFTWFLYENFTRVIGPAQDTEYSSWVHTLAAMYVISYAMMTISLLYLMVTPPGTVPKDWEPQEADIEPLAEDLQLRFCHACNCFQPPRAYHCKECDACILRREQHCSWFGCCIGFCNTKRFLLFLWNAACFLGFSHLFAGGWVWLHPILSNICYTSYGFPFDCYVLIPVGVLSFIIWVAFAILLGYQFTNITQNVTNPEQKKYAEMTKKAWEMQKQGQKNTVRVETAA